MPWKECRPMNERLKFIARLLEGEQETHSESALREIHRNFLLNPSRRIVHLQTNTPSNHRLISRQPVNAFHFQPELACFAVLATDCGEGGNVPDVFGAAYSIWLFRRKVSE